MCIWLFWFLLALLILSAVVLHSWHPEMGAFIML
nr:MAG TPA: Photosynthetic reaction center cytochrome c photosynthesis, Light-harvesting complex, PHOTOSYNTHESIS [Caudoviricetes sp.]